MVVTAGRRGRACCGPLHVLDAATRTAWARLAASAASGNAFLTPEFVQTAVARLPNVAEPWATWGETSSGELAWFGVFDAVSHSPRLPIRLLRAWQTPYSFRDGLLVAPTTDVAALSGLWESIRQAGWHAVEFPGLAIDAVEGRMLLESAIREDLGTSLGRPWLRPALYRQRAGASAPANHCSPRRAKSLRRGWRLLERQGRVEMVIRRGADGVLASAETLLRLEALGWKSSVGTALLSSPSHAQFFRELVGQLAPQGRVAFVELRVADEPIAALCNLISGDQGYAFKIGWDPACERGCPGFQIMDRLLACMPDEFPDLQLIDSCASPHSFITHVWPDSLRLAHCLFPLSRRARLVTSTLNSMRALRDAWQAVASRSRDIAPPAAADV